MKRVLITGAAGFLGSHVTDLMLKKGYHVVAVDDLSHGNLRNLEDAFRSQEFEFHDVDVCDAASLRLAAQKVDMVLHLAAYKIPRYENPKKTLLVNFYGTQNALQVAAEQGARFVITSTSDVYGKNPSVPFAEDDDSVLGPPTVARWAYAASKMFDEHLVLAIAEESGISATILRIFGSYGPRQNLTWWGGPQSVFINTIVDGGEIPIHGDGLQTRSFTFVEDTARGIVAAAESTAADGQIVNIGNSHEITILDLAQRIHRLCGEPGEPRIRLIPYDAIADRKYEDVRRRVPDTRKAERLIGFRAQISIDEGLVKTIEWQKRRMSEQVSEELTLV
ncbi:nucleoside-diphosphate-sugar epimerase [Terriglobus roseus DSM 18391]|uniref:Nucleoside-diphosphate-sugar epimerase n=1 Tax=Terriglobus roseus (strain DSM 18391 / NRRL B-41598 / KBS 63) TaxID=926566 RepID=I3ZEA8_TERRK|nr:GDP-mannose 4,6-dehydratase [Terriglobus roseus]AFL87576.1 nucleoside-diphosphate-sugar epimerase [Terriglobus roseus DSM 18391]